MSAFQKAQPVTLRKWNLPPGVVLDNIVRMYNDGRLDAVVAANPDLKRITDALIAGGHIQTVDGKLKPFVLPNGEWATPLTPKERAMAATATAGWPATPSASFRPSSMDASSF